MKKKPIIALITDFGSNDYFAGVMKGAIRSVNPSAEIIDICHDVKPFSVINAQYIVASSYTHFPSGTIFCVVVDPGVGTARRGIIAADELYVFIAPDNGIISPAASPGMRYYSIAEKLFRNIPATFHGRDVFAPVAASLAHRMTPEKFGRRIGDPVRYKFPDYKMLDKKIDSVVMHTDRFGNVIISVPAAVIDSVKGGPFSITCGGRTHPAGVYPAYDVIPRDEFGLIRGSAGFIEIAERQKSASEKLEAEAGDRLVISHE